MFRRFIKSYRTLSSRVDFIETQVTNIKYINRKQYLEEKILYSSNTGVSNKKYCNHEVIASLTSYGNRLMDVCYTIESLMQQTMLPNRIILNLDPTIQNKPLPISLKKQIERGLEINIVEDLRSYKKLIPTLESNPNAIIITFDDDLLYDFDVIERLFNSYIVNPNKIHALRVHTISYDENQLPKKYDEWFKCKDVSTNPFQLFATTGGGTLFPPASLPAETLNKSVFMSICPTADDIWIYAMALLKGTQIVKVPSRSPKGDDFIVNENVQDVALCNINTGKISLNDTQLKAVCDRYNLYNIYKSYVIN